MSAPRYSRFCRLNNIVGKRVIISPMERRTCTNAGANFIGGGNLRRCRKRSFNVLDKRDGICSRKLQGNISYSKVMRFFRYMKARRIYERNCERNWTAFQIHVVACIYLKNRILPSYSLRFSSSLFVMLKLNIIEINKYQLELFAKHKLYLLPLIF